MSSESLRMRVEELTPRLEKAVHTHPFYATAEPLGTAACGFATAILKEYGRRTKLFNSDRVIGTPLKALPIVEAQDQQHVILRLHDGTELDPTYGQFMSLVGLNAREVYLQPQLSVYYPTPKIALIEPGQHEAIGQKFAEHALSRRALLMAKISDASPYDEITDEKLREAYTDLWNPQHYKTTLETKKRDIVSSNFSRAMDVMMTDD